MGQLELEFAADFAPTRVVALHPSSLAPLASAQREPEQQRGRARKRSKAICDARSKGYQNRAVGEKCAPRILLVKHNGLIPVQEHAVFEVPADRAREYNFLEVASFLDQVLNRIPMGDANHVPSMMGPSSRTSVT